METLKKILLTITTAFVSVAVIVFNLVFWRITWEHYMAGDIMNALWTILITILLDLVLLALTFGMAYVTKE